MAHQQRMNGRNAARAAASAKRGYMTPAGLATLMTGLDEVASIQLPIATKRNDEYKQIKAFAAGDAEPGEALVAAAAEYGTTVEEIAQRWRDKVGTEQNIDAQSAEAIHSGYLLTAYSVRGRHAYYCTDEMAAVVHSAAESALQPNTSFTQYDLPSPHGIAYLSDPERPTLLRWCTTGQAVTVNLSTVDGLVRLLEEGVNTRTEHHVPQPFEHVLLSQERSDETPTIEVHRVFLENYKDITSENAAATLVAFSRLIQQERTADVSHESVRSRTVDKRGRKRTHVDQITYVTIHRTPRSETTDGDSGRNYTHRWVVRGHWRRQWYPSQERHIPIWINDHIAGPDDKPVLRRDKITILRQSPGTAETLTKAASRPETHTGPTTIKGTGDDG